MKLLLNKCKLFFIIPDFWFFLLILGMSILYGYAKIVTLEPQSTHVWRQTDCASIAKNYYQYGMDFKNPEIHFLGSDEKTSGYCVGEFPIIYYAVAGLYHVFGPYDFIFRLFNLLIFFLGLFALFKVISEVLGDSFWAIGISALFFCSPVIVFYANNFLPNVAAISLVFIAWYFFIRFNRSRSLLNLTLSIAFFTGAGLLKITSLLSAIPLFGLLLLEASSVIKYLGYKHAVFTHTKISLGLFLSSALIIYLWYQHAIFYNISHNSVYFSTHTWPLWSLTDIEINAIINKVNIIWMQEYWHTSVLFLLSILLITAVWKWTHFNLFFRYMIFTMMLGVIAYILLWFMAFGNHDYYVIDILVWGLFILVAFMDYFKQKHPKWFKHKGLKILSALFLVLNIAYAKNKIELRYGGWMNDLGNISVLNQMGGYIESLGVRKNDKVISIPDPSPNHSLYLINRKGWTDLYGWTDSKEKIEKLIHLGATHLIINDENVLKERPYLKEFTQQELGNKSGVFVYKLNL